MGYYTTSYIFNTSTTSTAALMVWQALSNQLEHKHLPMSAEEIMEASGLTLEYIDNLFDQSYYQKHYGFRRFDTLEQFHEWAMAEGVLYNPELHDPKPAEDPLDDDEEYDEDEDEEEEAE